MSWFKVLGVCCDTENCGEEYQHEGESASFQLVMEQAREEGWEFTPDNSVHCPQYRETYDY